MILVHWQNTTCTWPCDRIFISSTSPTPRRALGVSGHDDVTPKNSHQISVTRRIYSEPPHGCSLSGLEIQSLLSLAQEPFSEAAALFLRNSGLRPLRGHGAFLPDGGLPHPLRHVKEPSPPLIIRSPTPHLPWTCCFLYFPRRPGESGWLRADRGKTNKYCIIRCFLGL